MLDRMAQRYGRRPDELLGLELDEAAAPWFRLIMAAAGTLQADAALARAIMTANSRKEMVFPTVSMTDLPV